MVPWYRKTRPLLSRAARYTRLPLDRPRGCCHGCERGWICGWPAHVGRRGGEEFGAPACACSDFSRLPTLRPCASVNACRSRAVKHLFAFARADAWPSRAPDNLSAKTVASRGHRCPPPSRRVCRFAGRERPTMSPGEMCPQVPPSSWIAPTYERPTCSSALLCCAYGETSAAAAVAAAAAAAGAEAAAVVAAVWFGCYVQSRGVSRGLTLDGLRKHRDEEPCGVPARGCQARIHPVHQVSFSASPSPRRKSSPIMPKSMCFGFCRGTRNFWELKTESEGREEGHQRDDGRERKINVFRVFTCRRSTIMWFTIDETLNRSVQSRMSYLRAIIAVRPANRKNVPQTCTSTGRGDITCCGTSIVKYRESPLWAETLRVLCVNRFCRDVKYLTNRVTLQHPFPQHSCPRS